MSSADTIMPPPPGSAPALHPLLEHSLALKLHVMVRHIVDRERMAALREEHLRWVIGMETAGTVWMSGPTNAPFGASGIDGLTVIRAADAREAHDLAAGDPYVQGGAMSFDILGWNVVEGSLSVRVSISNGSCTVG